MLHEIILLAGLYKRKAGESLMAIANIVIQGITLLITIYVVFFKKDK